MEISQAQNSKVIINFYNTFHLKLNKLSYLTGMDFQIWNDLLYFLPLSKNNNALTICIKYRQTFPIFIFLKIKLSSI